MTDIENVISNLELNIRWICDNPAHQFPGYGNVEMAMRDAIGLLKEQDKTIGQLEEELARTDDMLRHYLNGNE